MPSKSRFAVTLATGAIATLAGMFPAIAMKLLGFVAIYGMVLMPMGAVIFIDYYFIRKLGMQEDYAEASGTSFNIAAGAAWIVTLCICVALVKFGGVQIYFVSLPGWFVAAVIYIVMSRLTQKKPEFAGAEA